MIGKYTMIFSVVRSRTDFRTNTKIDIHVEPIIPHIQRIIHEILLWIDTKQNYFCSKAR